jgi:hypothetical protein
MGLPPMTDEQGRLILGDDLQVVSGVGSANTALTVATPLDGLKRRILFATITYSASVTASASISLLSGLGAAWNSQLASISFSTNRYGLWVPAGRFVMVTSDQLQVSAPAGGAGVTCAIAIYCEILGASTRATPPSSDPTLVQSQSAPATTNTSLSIALPNPVQSGNTILVVAAGNITAVTDSLGNTYTADFQFSVNQGAVIEFWVWRSTAVAGGNCTVTLTQSSGGSGVLVAAIEEWRNLLSVSGQSPFDTGVSAGPAFGATSLGVGPITPASVPELILTAAVFDPRSTATPASPFVLDVTNAPDPNLNAGLAVAHFVDHSSGQIETVWNFSASESQPEALLVAYRSSTP